MSERAVIAIVALGVVMMCGVAFMRVLARITREVSRVSSPARRRSCSSRSC